MHVSEKKEWRYMLKKMYRRNLELDNIAQELIGTYPEFEDIRTYAPNILYLESDKKKTSNKKVVYADCEKNNDKHKSYDSYDFIITFYGDSKELNKEQKKRLMHHELLHVGVDKDKRWVHPHDLEDFKLMIDTYGTDWIDG